MTPKVLTISNFLSFAEPQTFVFPEAPGLYFMQGANVVEPRLGSNGAGKSSVWKALTWLLYGKTGEGLKAGDVCNWEVDRGVSVSLTFDDGNIITRTWKPNTFTRIDSDGEIHDLGKVDVVDILPIGMAAFMNSILIGQRQDMFLDAKPDQQAFLLGQVLELDKWIEFSQAASAMAGTLDFAIRKVELELARLGAFRDNRKDYSDLIAVWHSERSAKLAAVEKAYAEKLERSAKLKDEVDVLSKDEKTASGALNTARAQLTKSEDEFKASSSVMFAAIEAARDTLRDADAAKRQLEKVSREENLPDVQPRP